MGPGDWAAVIRSEPLDVVEAEGIEFAWGGGRPSEKVPADHFATVATAEIELPEGEDPLVIVHSSTAQDDELSLIGVALEALEGEPVRVVATMSRRGLSWPGPVPENAVVVDWVPYAQVMPQASLVVCSGGHGTVARVLAEGKPALVCPPGADMAENGARVTWAGAGLMLPGRLLRPGPLRLTVRRVVSDPRFAARAGAIAAWGRENDGAARGAALLERYASAGGARAGGER